jgi:hypothetical protein
MTCDIPATARGAAGIHPSPEGGLAQESIR